jgi:hypothetical protein
LQFDDNATDEEIEGEALEVYKEWVASKNNGYCNRIE